MLVHPKRSSAVIGTISGKSMSICNRFLTRWADSGKITILRGQPLLLMPSFKGNPLTKFCYKETTVLVADHSGMHLLNKAAVCNKRTNGRTNRQTFLR